MCMSPSKIRQAAQTRYNKKIITMCENYLNFAQMINNNWLNTLIDIE